MENFNTVPSQGKFGDSVAVVNENFLLAQQEMEILRNLISPDTKFVTAVATAQTTSVTQVLPATGSTDTVYRVGKWDGTQYDATVYSEYGWFGSQYKLLATKEYGIDTTPTAGSENLITSGAVAASIVYDISAAHSGAAYADLAAALGTNGSNVPDTVRKGGMSVKFIQGTAQSSDNKYVQYRLMLDTFDTTPANWQGVDDKPIDRSENLVKSGGVEQLVKPVKAHFKQIELNEKHQGQINTTTYKWQNVTGSSNRYHVIVPVTEGDKFFVIGGGSVAMWLRTYTTPVNDESADVISKVTLTANTPMTIIAPSGATYLYIHVQSGNNYYYPQYITLADNDSIEVLKKDITAEKNRAEEAESVLQENIATTLRKEAQVLTHEEKAQVLNNLGIDGLVTKVAPKILSEFDGDVTEQLCFEYGLLTHSSAVIDYDTDKYLMSIPIVNNNSSKLKITNNSNNTISVKVFAQIQDGRNYDFLDVATDSKTISLFGASPVKYFIIQLYKTDESTISIQDISNVYFELAQEDKSDISNIDNIVNGNIDLSNVDKHNGYISSGEKWTGTTSSLRTHIIIPCESGETFIIHANYSFAPVIFALSNYNVVESGDADVVDTISVEIGQSISYQVPSDVNYLYFQSRSGNFDYLPEKVYKKDGSLVDRVEVLENDDTDTIISLNNPKVLKQMLNNAKLTWSNRTPSFTMIHFSDMHNNQVNFDRIEEFVTHYNEYLDLILHTGDSVGGAYTQSAPIPWNDNAKFLNIIGNHDCMRLKSSGDIREGETEWDSTHYLAPRQAPYDKLFSPYISNWGVVRPTGATNEMYYYKDFTDYNIRLICLDRYYWDNTEKQWLIDVLADASTNEIEVIIANHEGAFKADKDASNPFDSLDYFTNNVTNMPEAVSAVKSFVDSGGTLICWLTGHMHADSFGMSTDSRYSGMLDICVSAAGKHLTNQEYSRPDGTKAMDLFNIYSIDVVKKRLSVVRIGADYDMYMRHKNSLVWDYANKQILYKD